jgi:hypothetical protein
MKLFFDDAEFDAQLQRTAAKAACRAADLGQVLSVARRIVPGDYASWYAQWSPRPQRASPPAKAPPSATTPARPGAPAIFPFRLFSPGAIPRVRPCGAWRRCRDAFRAAGPALPFAVEAVRIPWRHDIHLEGYVLRARNAASAPTVLMPCGYDSPVEEFYSLGGAEAALRGFNVVAFSGPGQAEMLYERGIPFRPDFETVVGPVIDFVERTDGLDPAHIALVGRSFGGYLAPRAASREPRSARWRPIRRDDMAANLAARFRPVARAARARRSALNDKVWSAFPACAARNSGSRLRS